MRRYFAYILVLIIAVCLGLLIASDPGYALFSYHHTTVEMPLWLAAFIAVVVFAIGVMILRLFDNTRYLLQKIAYWRDKQKLLRGQRESDRGLLELYEGRYQQAEKHLQHSAKQLDAPVADYLSAAQAANELAAYDRRDSYLSRAKDKDPRAETAVLIMKARLQLDKQQLAAAAHTLQRLSHKNPKHPTVLNLLRELYEKQQDWQSLLHLLPKLNKANLISHEAFNSMEKQAYTILLQQANNAYDYWQHCPRRLRHDPQLLTAVVNALMQQHQWHEAKTIIEKQLKRQWVDALCACYAEIAVGEDEQQYKLAEKWLRQQPENATLLATLGQLACRLQLWGKAKTYLQNSLAIQPNLQNTKRLGALLEQLGESKAALQQYREALQLSEPKN